MEQIGIGIEFTLVFICSLLGFILSKLKDIEDKLK